MKQYDVAAQTWGISSPAAMLMVVLAAALALAFLPAGLTRGLRAGWREAQRPALQTWATAAGWVQTGWLEFRSGGDLPQAQQTIADLTQQVRRLETQVQLAALNHDAAPSDEWRGNAQSNPLLVPQAIVARVLGRQAKAYLKSQELLDVGRSHGVMPQSLVIDDAALGEGFGEKGRPVIDQGRDAAVEPGRFVLAGSRVWGKIVDVGPHTSTVQRVNDAGYRDLVRLASRRDGRLHFAARGVLVGRGEALCKIDLVETTEPITVGDLVFSADDGVLQTPLLYGRVARLERKSGAAHWEIWMEPAVAAGHPPSQVAVLRMNLNPSRVELAGSPVASGDSTRREPGVRSQ